MAFGNSCGCLPLVCGNKYKSRCQLLALGSEHTKETYFQRLTLHQKILPSRTKKTDTAAVETFCDLQLIRWLPLLCSLPSSAGLNRIFQNQNRVRRLFLPIYLRLFLWRRLRGKLSLHILIAQ